MYRRVTPYARKRTNFNSRKEQGEILVKWSDRTKPAAILGWRGLRVTVIKLTFHHPGRPGDCQINNNNNNNIIFTNPFFVFDV